MAAPGENLAHRALQQRCRRGVWMGRLLNGLAFGGMLAAAAYVGRHLGFERQALEGMGIVYTFCVAYAWAFVPWHIRRVTQGDAAGFAAQRVRIQRFLEPLAARARMPVPRVLIIPTQASNAYAAGISRGHQEIGVTSGALQRLSDPELEALLAHELAHLYHRDTLFQGWWAAFLGVVMAAAVIIFAGAVMLTMDTKTSRKSRESQGDMALFGLALAATAMVCGAGAWAILVLWIRQDERRREQLADDQAMAWIAHPHVLGQALKKLEGHGTLFDGAQPLGLLFSVNAVSANHWYSRAFAAHPPMPQRLARIAQAAARNG